MLKSILANQITGKIEGLGPGSIESVHLSTSAEKPVPFGDVTPDANFTTIAAARPQQNLRFLRIEFNREVKGSLLERNRRVAVLGNVHAVYGPVDAWEQKLETMPRGSLGLDTVYIESQSLEVAQSPNARLTPAARSAAVELTAEGNVIIEGSAGKEGTFTARGASGEIRSTEIEIHIGRATGFAPQCCRDRNILVVPWTSNRSTVSSTFRIPTNGRPRASAAANSTA